MHLSLPQRMYLLSYTVDKEKFEAVNLQGRGQLLRAAALAELTFAGLLTTQQQKVVQCVGEPPLDPFLVDVWRDIPAPADKPKNWLQFVHNKATTSEEPVRDQLIAAGLIAPAAKRSLLSPLASHQVTVNDPQQVLELQETARRSVLGGTDPATVPVDELSMAVLPVECEMVSVFRWKETREHKHAFKAYAEQFDTLAPGLRKALRDSFLLVRGVGGGWGR
ncbi:GPP34 family phosphoprotein [Streptomyces sp. SID14478]|uniref:GPP34 family phosphoprotein n=1 Tax=Streptomyces sp. SID14478 TaxID=2706073 RepID=UPI0013D926EC|nr:GPP34 family phosphoprotein [Streptomyces sp. SID14478]NEB74658.1 GPP34 family phosphoprotein [Streptomyces sp. SID14478]